MCHFIFQCAQLGGLGLVGIHEEGTNLSFNFMIQFLFFIFYYHIISDFYFLTTPCIVHKFDIPSQSEENTHRLKGNCWLNIKETIFCHI